MSEKFKEFIEAYGAFTKSEAASRAMLSEDAGVRDGARTFALASAATTIPGFEAIAGDPVAAASLNDPVLDKLLKNAMLHFGSLSEQRYAADRKEILADTPDKGLAAIVLGLKPLDAKGADKKLKGIIETHKAYQDIAQALHGEGERPNHRALYNALVPYVKNRIEAKLSEDKYLSRVKGLDKATIETARFVLASSTESCLSLAVSMAEEYKKEFDRHLPSDDAKAKYAREILAGTKDIPTAMNAVYKAYEEAEKAKKGKKK